MTVQDIEKYEPVLRPGVRNHNDVKKRYNAFSKEAFDSFVRLNKEHQESQKVYRDKIIFQVKIK